MWLQDPSHAAFKEKMKEFMARFDKNADGRIEMSEVRTNWKQVSYWSSNGYDTYSVLTIFVACCNHFSLFLYFTVNLSNKDKKAQKMVVKNIVSCLYKHKIYYVSGIIIIVSVYLPLCSWLSFCPQRKTSCSVSESLWDPALNSWLWVCVYLCVSPYFCLKPCSEYSSYNALY